MKKLLILLFSILISFNSYGSWFGLTSIEDTTCSDFQKEAKGAKLKNLFGGEFKVLKVSNSREISRTKDKLVCIGDLKLDNGVSNSKLRMELTNEDGKLWYQYKQEINSTYANQTESSKKTVEDVMSRSKNLGDILSCKKITDNNKRLACFDSLSDGLTSPNLQVIPSITKLGKERKLTIGGLNKPFYGCISEIWYGDKDVMSGKRQIVVVQIGDSEGSAILYVKDFAVLFEGDEKSPKVGDCFAFIDSRPLKKVQLHYRNQTFGRASTEIYANEYIVDEEIVYPVLKDKLTVDEYFEDGVIYGSKIIELTGVVIEVEIGHYFTMTFSSDNHDEMYAIYHSDYWKDDETIKDKIRSIKPLDKITLKGHFDFNYGNFNVLKIIDATSN